MFLLKRKLKGSSKGHNHNHSSTNANKNIEQNKSNKMPVSTYMSYLSPGNNYLFKKKAKEKATNILEKVGKINQCEIAYKKSLQKISL